MPRDLGTGVYTQPYPDVEAGTPIESSVYNGFTHDVEQDLNTPRPIVAGGTGANNALDAMLALNGEIAKQAVTNYDSYVFKPGSFYSTNAPGQAAPVDGHAFVGVCTQQDANNMVIKATDLDDTVSPARTYIRVKDGGVWGAWKVDGLTAGGTATGNITISKSDPALILDKTGGSNAGLWGYVSGSNRWLVAAGNGDIESGSNAGSNFSIYRYADNGAFLGNPLTINRANGNANFANDLTAGGNAVIGGAFQVGSGSTGIIYFGNSGSHYLQWDGGQFNLTGFLSVSGDVKATNSVLADGIINTGFNTGYGSIYFTHYSNDRRISFDGSHTHANNMGTLYWDSGSIRLNGDVVLRSDIASGGTLFFGNSGARNLSFDGSNFIFNGAGVWCYNNLGTSSDFNASGTIVGNKPSSAFNASGWTGSGSPWINYAFIGNPNYGTMQMQFLHYSGNYVAIQFDTAAGNTFQLRHDSVAAKTGGSTLWVLTSDARAKDVTGDYTAGLDEVAALQPRRFRYKNNTTNPNIKIKVAEETELTAEGRASREKLEREMREKEWVGLVAQEGEKVMPEMFITRKGFLDGREIDDLREADYTPLMFAMINAIKQLKARVEELEAAR